MGFLSSIIGKLPASDSEFLKLNALDLKKVARLAIVTFIGTFCLYVTGVADLQNADLPTVFQDAAMAGITAVGAAAVEIVRRLFSGQ